MVTSSAVVGSSAISSAGSQASAIAIITRWRIPPDNSCGYCAIRLRGIGHLHLLQQGQRAARARVPGRDLHAGPCGSAI